MTRIRLLATGLSSSLALFVWGCAPRDTAESSRQESCKFPPLVSRMVGEVEKGVKSVEMDALAAAIRGEEDPVVIDVREPDEYRRGHVSGAVNVPRGLLEFSVWACAGYPQRLNTRARIFVYAGDKGRAVLAARSLSDLGFKDVSSVRMTMAAWRDAGYPVSR